MTLGLLDRDGAPSGTSAPDVALCPFHGDKSRAQHGERKTLVLTGASRGIGHATGKLFSEAGWRIITCSRQPFDGERCPWDSGMDNHVQVELSDHRAAAGGRRDQGAAQRRAAECTDQQCRHFAQGGRWHTAELADDAGRDLDERVPRQPARAGPVCAGPRRRAEAGCRRDRQCHLDRRLPGASVCRHRLCDVEGCACVPDPRDGARLCAVRNSREQRSLPAKSRPISCRRRPRPNLRRSFRCIASARRTRSRR